jgi:preprotein translocase subunit SecA
MDLLKYLAMEIPMDEDHFFNQKVDTSIDEMYEAALSLYKRKTEKMATVANPVIQQVYEKQAAQYENILIPVTDGKRTYNIPCNLKAAAESQSKEVVKTFEKAILLHTIDEAWKENLRELDELRQSVQNASYEQKDPLLIYKLESYNLFKTMIENINKKSISILMRGQIPIREPEAVRKADTQKRHDYSKYRAQKEALDAGKPARQAGPGRETREQHQLEPVRVEKKLGRNDPCPCGSGKKYKNCHGKGL